MTLNREGEVIASNIQGEAERAETVYSREDKAQGNLIHMHKYLTGRSKETRDILFSVVTGIN